MAEQLTFSLPARAALGRDAFFVSAANAIALGTLDQWAHWPSGKLVLVGPAGSGKTHLAHVWASETGARIIDARGLPEQDIATLARLNHIVVEDVDRCAGSATVETALFHLHNLLLAENGRLLVTARTAPSRWGLTLPDLASRMQATSLATIDAPDDALLSAMLIKQFDDRQIGITPQLINYLVKRIERSAQSARDIVAALDAKSLSERRPITLTMAGELLDKSVT